MKAISIRNPYATDILDGNKKFEYRSWPTNHRGDLLICSSAAPNVDTCISGHAIGIVSVTDCIKVDQSNYRQCGLSFTEKPGKNEVLYAWQLENVRLIKPFPVKGKLNFYYVEDEKIEIIHSGYLIDAPDEIFQLYDRMAYHKK